MAPNPLTIEPWASKQHEHSGSMVSGLSVPPAQLSLYILLTQGSLILKMVPIGILFVILFQVVTENYGLGENGLLNLGNISVWWPNFEIM